MAQQVISVTQINEYIRSMMDADRLLANVAVKGEVSNYKLYPSGHHYFTLKDEGGALRCVMFRGSAGKLRFKPENGMTVLCNGNTASAAEVFTATLQSLAYVESNIRVLLDTALSKIPAESAVAKTVRLVIEAYDNGVDYREVREQVLKFNEKLGWFQAPANLGFVTIGLLYGEGDFKKSML